MNEQVERLFKENGCTESTISEVDKAAEVTQNVSPKKAKVTGIIAFVCGLVGLVISLFFGIGLSVSVAGLILAIVSKKAGSYKLTKAGKILSIIGVALSILWAAFIWYLVYAGYYTA